MSASTRNTASPHTLPGPQIQQLEATLAQYGYRDLYAPLPPENPLDMLELTASGRGQQRQMQPLGALGWVAGKEVQGACVLANGGEALPAWLWPAAQVQPAALLHCLCADMEGEGEEHAEGDEAAPGSHASEELLAAEGSLDGEVPALGEVTNRLATTHLAADCDASPAAQRGGALPPRTALKAMAPMTAAKALMRPADTPSSLASPEALSPSMR